MKNFLNLWVEEINDEKLIMYQTSEKIEKIDDEYNVHILSKIKIAGRLENELTINFIESLLKSENNEKK